MPHYFPIAFTTLTVYHPVLHLCLLLVCMSGFSQENKSSHSGCSGNEGLVGCDLTQAGRRPGTWAVVRDLLPQAFLPREHHCPGAVGSPRRVSAAAVEQVVCRSSLEASVNLTSAHTWQQSPENKGFLSSNLHLSQECFIGQV